MTIRDVVPTSDFYADLRQQLDPSGTTGVPHMPTRDQFDAYEMPSILHAFATGWDQLPERFQGNPRYRVLIRTGLLVAAYAVTGELLPDGRIALVALRIDPSPPDEAFLDAERAAMDECRLAKTANRSTVGIMTEFSFLAGVIRTPDLTPDLTSLAVDLARTPCSRLYKTHTSPDRALAAHLARHEVEQPPRGHAEPLSRLIHPSPGHGRPARADRRNETCP